MRSANLWRLGLRALAKSEAPLGGRIAKRPDTEGQVRRVHGRRPRPQRRRLGGAGYGHLLEQVGWGFRRVHAWKQCGPIAVAAQKWTVTWTEPDSLAVRNPNSSRVIAVQVAPFDAEQQVRPHPAFQAQPRLPL